MEKHRFKLARCGIHTGDFVGLVYLLDFLYLRFEKEQIFSRPQESAAVEHQKIFDAVIAGSTREAKKAMRDHIRSVKDNVLQDLRNRILEADKIEI